MPRSKSKFPFHFPSAVISPNSGLDCLPGERGLLGLKAACGWLLALRIVLAVEVEEKEELLVSNDVDGDLRGEPGGFFCSFLPSPLPAVGSEGFCAVLGAVVGRLYRSRDVCEEAAPALAVWSQREAMSLTLPGWREGSRAGLERTLFNARVLVEASTTDSAGSLAAILACCAAACATAPSSIVPGLWYSSNASTGPTAVELRATPCGEEG